MIIKNYLVLQNIEHFIDELLSELCRRNISYVYIDSVRELHIENYIYRFFDEEEALEFIKYGVYYNNDVFRDETLNNIYITDAMRQIIYRIYDIKYNMQNDIELQSQQIEIKTKYYDREEEKKRKLFCRLRG